MHLYTGRRHAQGNCVTKDRFTDAGGQWLVGELTYYDWGRGCLENTGRMGKRRNRPTAE